jgi:hypothetical protein
VRRRLSSLLALDQAEADLLIARCSARIGGAACTLRLAVFLLVTAPIVRSLLPPPVQRRAIRPFIYPFLSGVSENLLYADVEPEIPDD